MAQFSMRKIVGLNRNKNWLCNIQLAFVNLRRIWIERQINRGFSRTQPWEMSADWKQGVDIAMQRKLMSKDFMKWLVAASAALTSACVGDASLSRRKIRIVLTLQGKRFHLY